MDMRKDFYNIRMKVSTFILPLLIGFTTMLKANTFIVTNTRSEGAGSLKYAINKANALAGKDKIIFKLGNPEGIQVIHLGAQALTISDELIIDGFEGSNSVLKNANTKTVKVFFDYNSFSTTTRPNEGNTEGGIFSLKNVTFRGIGLVKNNPLKIQNGADFVFENCIFTNNDVTKDSYINGVPMSDERHFINCLTEAVEPSNNAPVRKESSVMAKVIRQFSNVMQIGGFDFSKFVQNNVDLSLISKNLTNCNVLKLYPDTITESSTSKHVLYRIKQNLVDTVPAESNAVSIIVSEHAIIVAQPNDITECVGSGQQLIIAISGGTGNITYQWQGSTDGMSYTDIPGATATTYTPPSTVAGTNYYRVVITSDVDGCGPITSTAATVLVVDDPAVTLAAEKDIICEGETASLKAAVTGGVGTVTYQWQSSTDGATWTDVAGATDLTLTTQPLSVNTQFRVIVRQSTGCETISAPLVITMGACNGVIGDFVWLDCDKNGIQDGSENGINGVNVILRGSTVSGEAVNQTTSTAGNGHYEFKGIKPGKYTLTFSTPSTITGLTFTTKKQGNDGNDSDVDGSGKTDIFTLGPNQVTTDFDAGFKDVTAPDVTQASDLTVSCDGTGNEVELKNWLLNHGGATAVDNMSTNLIWTNDYTALTKTCGGSAEVKVTFTVTDECGNSAKTSATFKIKDDQAPVFSNVAPDVKLKCGDVAPAVVTPSVSDACDPAPVVSFDEQRQTVCGNSFRIIRTWTAKDACGNVATATQTITMDDNEPPRLINIPNAITLTCNERIPNGAGVTAVDNCDGNPRVTMSDLIERGVCGSNYKINRLWTAIDICGNVAKATQVITVGDYDAPVIRNVPNDVTVNCGNLITSPSKSVTATDNCSSSVRLSVNDKINRGACPDQYTVARTWTATDVCGNIARKTQNIAVKDDVKPELIQVPNDITVNLYLGQKIPNKPNIIGTDNCDSRVDVSYTETKVNNLCGQTIKRTWIATDNCQNRDEKTQIITVRNAENLAKVLSVKPENCNEQNGEVVLSPSTSNYTYKWSDGKTGFSRKDLSAGTYKVTATSSANCSIEVDVVVKRECDCDRPVVSVSKVNMTCATPEGGSATLNIANALPADLKFIWTNNVSTSNKATNLPAGDYTVRVERINKPSCFTEIKFTINGIVYPNVLDPIVTPSSCNSSTGKIQFNVPLSDSLIFKWADGSSATVREGLASGMYTVTISRPNSNTCPLVKKIDVTSDNPLTASFTINRQPSCGLPNGAVTITTTGGSGNYKYSWGEGNSRFVLPAGPVNVTVTDLQTGCFTVVSFVLLNQSPQAIVTMVDSTCKVSCPGMSDGRAVFNATYGQGFALPAKFEIRDMNNNYYSNGALPVGNNYVLMVKDSLGCLASETKFKVVNPPVIIPSFVKTNQTCDSLGTITLTTTGGTGAYKYQWADLGTQTDQPSYRESLKSGFYSVTISDVLGCQKLLRNIQVLDSCACRPPVVDSLSIVNANCGSNNGEVTINLVGGGESNYTYTWTPATGIVNNVGNKRSGIAAGTYNVVITAKNNLSCTTTVNVGVGSVEGPKDVTITTAAAICEAANGSALLTSTFSPAYTYTWLFDNKIAASRGDLKKGLYQVKVSRANDPNCFSVITVRIDSKNNLSGLAVIKQKSSCGAADGIAAIRVTGGSGTYSYSWGSDSLRRDLRAGLYTVTATDNATTCKLPVTFIMEDQMAASTSITISNPIVYLNCTGGRNGRVNYKVNYGSGFEYPAQVSITNANGRTVGNDSLVVGNYCIVIKDAKGCTAASQCFEVREPQPIKATFTKENRTCTEGGRITLKSVSGGSGSYLYVWSDLSVIVQSSDRVGLKAGTYSVTVYDTKGCSFMVDTILVSNECTTQNDCAAFTATNIAANKSCTEGGNITVKVNGGSAPFTFDWADLEGNSNPQNRFGLDSGKYSVTIVDATGCKTQLNNIVIKNTCTDVANCIQPVIGDIAISDATCSQSNGQIAVTVNRPSTVTYQWTPKVSTNNIANGVKAGIYKLKIMSANDSACAVEKNIIVKNQDGVKIGQPIITAATCGASNGKVEFPSVGTILNYTWSDGKSGSVRTNLAKGTYLITITDPTSTACTQYTSVEVPATNTLAAVAMVEKRSVCGQSNGQATLKVLGGSGSYSYSWGPSATNANLKSGVHNVTVTDNQTGCQTVVTVTMIDDVVALASVSISQPIIYLSCAGENNASVVYKISYSSGFALPSRVVIADNFGRTATNDKLSVGRYAIFVYDKNNCLAGMGNFEVREPQMLMLSSSVSPQTCADKGSIVLSVSGGSGIYTYTWGDLTGTNQPNVRTGLGSGDYIVTVTDSKGCSKVSKITIRNEAFDCNNKCDLQVSTVTSAKTCTDGGKITVTIVNGSGKYGFLWSDLGDIPGQPQNRTDMIAGTYAVNIIDSVTFCKVKLSDIVVENKAIGCEPSKCTFIATADIKNKTCTEGGSILITPLTGIKPYIFDWLDLQGIENPQNRYNLIAGKYTVVIIDSLGCRDTIANIAVVDSCVSNCTPPTVSQISITDASCFEANGAVSISISGTGSFIYKWSPNVSNTNTATGLSGGTYKVRIAPTQDSTCFIEKTIVVNNKNTSIVLTAPTVTDAACGASNGSISINGQPNWVYTWNDGFQGRVRSNLAAKTYIVSVTDPSSAGCPVIQEVVVKMTGSVQAMAQIDKKPSCGASNGQVTISVTGGSGNYTYSWGSAVRSNLKAGSYNVTVFDNQTGCSGVVTVNLTEDIPAPATVKFTTTDFKLKCRGDQTGRVDFTLSYGTGFVLPATTKIVDALGNTVQNGSLQAGQYKILVSDANGCLASVMAFELTEPDMIAIQAAVQGANCNVLGSITLTVAGGTGSMIYDWADLAGTNDTKNRVNVNAGTYSVTVKDANGCTAVLKNIVISNLCTTARPKVDTLYRTIIASSSDTVCLTTDPALVGQTLSNVFCNGSQTASSNLGLATIGTNGCIIYKAGSTFSRDQICVRSCNPTGICDTTIIFFDIVADPQGCKTSYLGATTLSVINCDSSTTACTNIPYSQWANYTVTDNGKATQFVATGCKQDTITTYSYFSLTKFYPNGPWDLQSWIVNGKTYSVSRLASLQVLVDSLNSWDKNGNWAIDANAKTIYGGNNTNVYGNMIWKRSGRVVATFQPNRQFVPAVLSLRLAVGTHKLVFTNKLKGCKDSTNITVICNADSLRIGSYTIDTVMNVGDRYTVCLNNSLWASQTTIRNICLGSYKGYTGYAIDENTDCIRLVGVVVGRDTLCLRRCYPNGSCDTVKIIVSVKPSNSVDPSCTKVYTGINYYNVPCGTNAKLCTNIQGVDTLSYSILDNGVGYKNGFYACTADTIYTYSYFSLILSSPAGPWSLDSWIVNGTTFSGSIPNIRSLVDSLNKWDAGGNWVLNSTNYTIKGGKSGNNYGNMTWSKNSNRIGTFAPTRQLNVKQVGIYLATGRHQIIFKNISKGCLDTANIVVECRQLRTRPTMTLVDTTIYVNETGKYCVPANGLLAANTQITTISNTKGYVNYVVDDKTDCIVLTGANIGRDTISLQRCDMDGECDTIKLAVNVLKRGVITSETIFHSIKVGKDSTYCVKTNELTGKKFTLRNICDKNSTDNVNFIISGTCVTYLADNPGVDTACLVVCDELGNCDTTRLIVYVIQEREALPVPIAIRDRATTAKGTNVIIKPMDNDSIFGLPSNIIVLTQPSSGILSFDPATNSVVYSPTKGSDCINRDSFRYAVVNVAGLDTAEVAVEVLCDDIVVFSGFSPNGDGCKRCIFHHWA